MLMVNTMSVADADPLLARCVETLPQAGSFGQATMAVLQALVDAGDDGQKSDLTRGSNIVWF